MWKGSVRECRDHFNEKHSGSETLDFDRVSKSFPAWTVTRDFWERALKPEISGIAVDIRLFLESGRRLIHKYRVYQDPLPYSVLREGRITKLISLVNRAMVIAKLTHLRIAIPLSGSLPGEVPSDCFPKMDELGVIKMTKRVSFAPVCQTSTEEVEPLSDSRTRMRRLPRTRPERYDRRSRNRGRRMFERSQLCRHLGSGRSNGHKRIGMTLGM